MYASVVKLIYAKSKWEMWNDPLESILRRTKADGFDAAEIYLPAQSETPQEIARQVADHGLLLVAQINSEGATSAEHRETLQRRFAAAVETELLLVNSHTGRDILSFEANVDIFRAACKWSGEAGDFLANETHRSRPTSRGPATAAYLKAVPKMRLTADLSHWFCVHETDLTDKPENVASAIDRAIHVHARVGFESGSQVGDPLASEWTAMTDCFIGLWQRIIDARRAAGADFLTITPVFGQPPYMPVNPRTRQPVADARETNKAFLPVLRQRLR